MLRLFFFAMTYVTDCRGTTEFVQAALTSGLMNSGVACIAGVCRVMRGRQMKRRRSRDRES